MENAENRVELTDQQLNAVTGGLSVRLAGYSCGVFEESEESIADRCYGGAHKIQIIITDCTHCKWWNSEDAVCTLGYHSEPRLLGPEWPGADPAGQEIIRK